MKKLLLLFLSVLLSIGSSFAKKNDQAVIPDYLIEGAGNARGGESVVKVSVIVKKKSDATDDMLAKAAVHGVLFKGYSDKSTQGYGGASEHSAIAGSPTVYSEHIDFFDPFFRGDHMNYVRFIDDTRSAVKVGKEYRVSAIVRVASGQLKKDLQSKNIGAIRGLNSGW